MKEYKGFKDDKTEPGYEEYKTLVEDTRRNIKGLKLQLAITTGILKHAIGMMKFAKPPKEEELSPEANRALNEKLNTRDIKAMKKTPKTPDTADTDHKEHKDCGELTADGLKNALKISRAKNNTAS